MRFGSITLLAAMCATAAADALLVYRRCGGVGNKCESPGVFYTDYGEYEIDANEGCRRIKVPYLEEFCVDYRNQRAHFRFGGQSKRCMTVVSSEPFDCASRYCWKFQFQEITCSWKLMEDEGAFGVDDGMGEEPAEE